MSTSWSFGGTDLASFGKITLLDDYLDFANRRGSNVVIPFRHGSIFAQKMFDERHLTFGITVNKTSNANLEAGLDTMRQLFAPLTQQTLSNTREDGTIRTVSATVDRLINPKRYTGQIAFVVVEFVLTFPFFRLSTAIADNTTTINANPKAMTVTNPGTVEERDATITLTGPLANTVITNSTNGCVLTYTGTIASPRVVTISRNSTGEYVATNDLGTNVIGNLTHSGSAALMVFNVGANTLSIADDTHTTGTVKVAFNAPFI